MRVAFGVVSLLIVAAIVLYLWGMSGGGVDQARTAVQTRDTARGLAHEMSGRERESGRRKSDALTLDVPSGAFRSARVLSIEPSSELAGRYGVRAGDEIVRVGSMDVGSVLIASEEDLRVQIDALRAVEPITVRRDGQTVVLDPENPATTVTPTSPDVPAVPPDTESTVLPASPATGTPDRPNPTNPLGSRSLQEILERSER